MSNSTSLAFVRRVFTLPCSPKRQCRVYCDQPDSDDTTLAGVAQMLSRVVDSVRGAADNVPSSDKLLQQHVDYAVVLMDACSHLRNSISDIQQYATRVKSVVSSIKCGENIGRGAVLRAKQALDRVPAPPAATDKLTSSLRRVEERCRRSRSGSLEESCSNIGDAYMAVCFTLRSLLPSSGNNKSGITEFHLGADLASSVKELSGCLNKLLLECSAASGKDVVRLANVAYGNAKKLEASMLDVLSHLNAIYGSIRDIRMALL